MKLLTFNKNDMEQNIFLYYDEKSGEGVLIDAGCSEADHKDIVAAIANNNITIKGILLTHAHYDHITAVDILKGMTNAASYCHESEKEILETPNFNLSSRTDKEINITPDNLFKDGDVFRFGNTALKVLHTPGYTPGGVCYYDENNGNLFTGDTLFHEAVGRTDFPYGNHQELLESIRRQLLILPEDTKVYPGHDVSTTIGHEKRRNPFL